MTLTERDAILDAAKPRGLLLGLTLVPVDDRPTVVMFDRDGARDHLVGYTRTIEVISLEQLEAEMHDFHAWLQTIRNS